MGVGVTVLPQPWHLAEVEHLLSKKCPVSLTMPSLLLWLVWAEFFGACLCSLVFSVGLVSTSGVGYMTRKTPRIPLCVPWGPKVSSWTASFTFHSVLFTAHLSSLISCLSICMLVSQEMQYILTSRSSSVFFFSSLLEKHGCRLSFSYVQAIWNYLLFSSHVMCLHICKILFIWTVFLLILLLLCLYVWVLLSSLNVQSVPDVQL